MVVEETISYININGNEHPIDACSIDGKNDEYFQESGKLVNYISSSSTDDEYPSAKCLYDMIWGTGGEHEDEPLYDYSNDYLTFDIVEGGTVAWKKSTNYTTNKTISYSLNDSDWTEITPTTAGTSINVNSGDKIKFKGTNTSYYTSSYYHQFTGTATFNISGNIMSLIGGDDFSELNTLTSTYTFYRLFYGCGVLSCRNLILPATTLASYCYYNMFRECRRLTTPPELPAIKMKNSCYSMMFEDCTSLTVTPELPATTLAVHCYNSMFSGCINLTTVPELPVTTLAEYCYSHMFYGCTSLTSVPELPATKMKESCYTYMFYGCTGLTGSLELPATTLANCCYDHMFFNTDIIPDCTNIDFLNDSVVSSGGLRGLFAGTKVTDSDLNNILPKNTNNKYYLPKMASSCYSNMFRDCINLTTPPELPSTTLEASCYVFMFAGCTSLTTAPELPATTLAAHCYESMFSNCRSLTSAPELPATTLSMDCYNDMFSGCTSLTTAPELPATTLENSCYAWMFYGCTSLTASPILPATDINVFACYYHMFNGCTNLRRITCYAEGNYDTYNTDSWVYNVSRTGTFTCKDDSIWTRGTSGIPQNWTTNIDTYDLFNSAGLYGMYIDDFLKANPYDFVEDPINNNCNAYEYTGESINYDGDDYYVWKNMGYESYNYDSGSEHKCYALTSTINQNTLQQKSLEYSTSNLSEHPIYMYLESDGDEYTSGQPYNIVSISQTTGLEMWIDEEFYDYMENDGYSDMEEYLDWYLDNIDEIGGKHYYYIDTFEYDGDTCYIWYCYIDHTYLLTDTNDVNTLTSYSIEYDYSNVDTHPIIIFLNKDLTEYNRNEEYSIVKVISSQPKQIMYVDDFIINDINIDDVIDDPESMGANYYEYCEPLEYEGNTYYVWIMIPMATYSTNVKYILTDTINLQTLQSYSLESSITNMSTFPIVTYLDYDFDETYTNENKFDNIIKVFEL